VGMTRKSSMSKTTTSTKKGTTTKSIARKYKPYPAYKDSEVEWLGEIPDHWTTESNRWLFHEFDSRSLSGEEELLTVSHITGVTRRSEKPDVTMIEAESCEGYKICEKGDLAINTMWAWMGALGIAREQGIVSPSYNVFKSVTSSLSTSYYDYLCRVPLHVTEIIRHSKGIWQSQLRLYPDEFQLIHTPIPSEPEQNNMVTFLDRQTSKIDALSAKYARLLELLAEKRSALISRAVTKGLDPDAPMKDSGVEWLGEIPEGWITQRLKYIVHTNPESLPEDTDPSFAFRYIDIGSVDEKEGIGSSEEMVFGSAPSRARRIVRENDLIISTVRTYLRAIAQIQKSDDYMIVSTGFAVLRCIDILPKFLRYALAAPYFIEKVVAYSTGIGYPAINESTMSCFPIALPGPEEQKEIAGRIEGETSKIDALVAKVERAVELLKEYRVAFISAAVTGKIDLREESA
jgi:type I restriction enzyme, S subunit